MRIYLLPFLFFKYRQRSSFAFFLRSQRLHTHILKIQHGHPQTNVQTGRLSKGFCHYMVLFGTDGTPVCVCV